MFEGSCSRREYIALESNVRVYKIAVCDHYLLTAEITAETTRTRHVSEFVRNENTTNDLGQSNS